AEQAVDSVRIADRIARDHEDAVLDPVAGEGGSLLVEEVLLVAAELEERERVGAVPADEVSGLAAELGLGQVAGSGERAEEEVRRDEQRQQSRELHGERHLTDLVVEGER